MKGGEVAQWAQWAHVKQVKVLIKTQTEKQRVKKKRMFKAALFFLPLLITYPLSFTHHIPLSFLSACTVEVLFLAWGVRLCIMVRKAPSEFNESRFISMAIYNEFLLTCFLNVSM